MRSLGDIKVSACAVFSAALLLAGAFAMLGAEAGRGEPASELRERAERAEQRAGELREDTEAERSAAAEADAAAQAAAQEELSLDRLLSGARARSQELVASVAAAERRYAVESARLARARKVLSARLVAIYKSGPVELIEVALSAEGYADFVTRSQYAGSIESADRELARRVEEIRAAIARSLDAMEDAREEARSHQADLELAYVEVAEVRAGAEAVRADHAAAAGRQSQELQMLGARAEEWADAAERVDRRRLAAEAARQEAEERPTSADGEEPAGGAAEDATMTPGGPYAIPEGIVTCESGGNYRALNPSSGAGGAYQIIPSTWEAYGGEGLPHQASKAEQDRIAALIWADVGASAWVCQG